MTTARQGHTASLLSNGQVLVAGGNNGSSSLSSAELYNGTSWSATTAMPAAVQAHTASTLASGIILIAGGVNGSTTTSAARLYDVTGGNTCTSGSQCQSVIASAESAATRLVRTSATHAASAVLWASARRRPMARRATTATSAPRPTLARAGLAPVQTLSSAQRSTNATSPARAINPPASVPIQTRPMARAVMTTTHVHKRTRARVELAPARTRSSVRRSTSAMWLGFAIRSTGVCSNPNATDGTGCSDSNACTLSDTCQSGTCTSGSPKSCTASDLCHLAGTCNPSTGSCSNPAAPDGTACTDNNACTAPDQCASGNCQSGSPVSVDAGDPCTIDSCDPVRALCHSQYDCPELRQVVLRWVAGQGADQFLRGQSSNSIPTSDEHRGQRCVTFGYPVRLWVNDTSGSSVVPQVLFGGCITSPSTYPACGYQVNGVTQSTTQLQLVDPIHRIKPIGKLRSARPTARSLRRAMRMACKCQFNLPITAPSVRDE